MTMAIKVRAQAPLRIRTNGGTNRLTAQLGIVVLIIAVWWIAAHFQWLGAEILPAPGLVFLSFFDLAASPSFWLALWHTISSAMTGLFLGIVVGIPVGLFLGIFPSIERMTRLLMDLGRSFPVIALLPVMILTFGATSQMEIVVIFLGVVWPIMLQTVYGSRRLDPVVRDTVRSFQIPIGLRFFKVLLPSSAPFAATGIRVAASVSILLALAVEVLGKTPGMGFELVKAQTNGRPELALAYIFYAGFLGVALNTVLAAIEDRVLVWNTRGDTAVESK